MQLIFEAHATTADNEQGLASGWYDVQLSELGRQQAIELGERYKATPPDVVFCSDLGRAVQTAAIAFGGDLSFADPAIIRIDWRLRECDYGTFTHRPEVDVRAEKPQRIAVPFPDGESYEQVVTRIDSFLADMKRDWQGKRVLVIGHRATQYGFEHLLNNIPLEKLVTQQFVWQPGWQYSIS